MTARDAHLAAYAHLALAIPAAVIDMTTSLGLVLMATIWEATSAILRRLP